MDGLLWKIVGWVVMCIAYYKVYLQYAGTKAFDKKLFILATLLLISNIWWLI